MNEFLQTFLGSLNQSLAAAIVIVAASMLLYNLSRNLKNRVSRTSAAVLGAVTLVYVGDVLIALDPTVETARVLLRFQWLGLAFIPAASFHLSDALLATTGLPSRGRRKRVVRVLYALASTFLILATFSDRLIRPEVIGERASLRPGNLFLLYLAYFVIVNAAALVNVWRARSRCLTRSTQRRMTYLFIGMLTPSIGVFPYSVLLDPGGEFSLLALLLVNLTNLVVIGMLMLLAYPLSFFGSRIPDRVVKAELLRFMLLGPMTGMLALTVMVFTEPATQIVGVIGRDFLPFAVVSVILLWQWGVDVFLPTLERLLIYSREDDDQLAKISHLSERLLTRSDLLQLLEATLEAACDSLRVTRAFVIRLVDDEADCIAQVGAVDGQDLPTQHDLLQLSSNPERSTTSGHYLFIPLCSSRLESGVGQRAMIGVMGIEQPSDPLNEDRRTLLERYKRRAANTLDDLLLQEEVYAALAGLLPQFSLTRSRAAEVEYRPGRNGLTRPAEAPDRDQVLEQVHAALRHYWGGPGLASSRLSDLAVVKAWQDDSDGGPVKALRELLLAAIETLRPEGERDYRSAEWLLYNILTLRFIDSKKAKDTARRLYISEANLYRKQNAAIEAVADAIIRMEQEHLTQSAP